MSPHAFRTCVVMLSLLLSFVSCTNDEYESGDGEYSYMRADFVEAHSGDAGYLTSFVTDEGDSLLLSPKYECLWATTPDSVYRALMYYSREDSSSLNVRGISISQVFMLYLPKQPRDTVYVHPVGLESSWMSANGKYFNMGLNLRTGKGENEKARQTLGVVLDTTLLLPNGSHEHHLRLFHNQGEVPEYYTTKVYASIPMAYFSPGDVVSLSVNTYDGLVTRSFTVATNQ